MKRVRASVYRDDPRPATRITDIIRATAQIAVYV
jgi:hypothetical protein